MSQTFSLTVHEAHLELQTLFHFLSTVTNRLGVNSKQISSSPKVHIKQRKLVNPSSYYPLLLLRMVHGANANDIPDSHSAQPLISS